MFPARLSLRDNKRGGKLLFIISLSGAQRKFLGSFPRIKSLISRGEMWLFMRGLPDETTCSNGVRGYGMGVVLEPKTR